MVVCLLLLAAAVSAQPLPPPEHELLDRARWYVLVERWDDAIKVAQELEARFPAGRTVEEARYLRHKARLFRALERTVDDPPLRSAASLIQELEALSREPLDDAVAASKLALATAYYLATSKARPESLVREALRDWRTIDGSRARRRVRSPHEADVIEIRNVLFQPFGGGVFAGDSRWSDVRWASRSAPYLFVNPALSLYLGEHERARLIADEPFPDHPNVLFMDPERRVLIDRIIRRLGTVKKRSWMKPGRSLDVTALWQKASFGVRGRWGGWVFDTPPRIAWIQFLDQPRTIARVGVEAGYARATVWMEKKSGVWVARGIRDFRVD